MGVFLSEISTVKMRGPLIAISQTSCCVGQLIGASICIFLPIEFLSLVLASHSFLVIILILFISRSPQWLVKSKEDDARKSMITLRGNEYPGIDMEIIEIRNCVKERESVDKSSVFKDVTRRTFTMPLLVSTVIFMVLGTWGNDTILFYGPKIFTQREVGIPTTVLSTLPWIGMSIGFASRSTLYYF